MSSSSAHWVDGIAVKDGFHLICVSSIQYPLTITESRGHFHEEMDVCQSNIGQKHTNQMTYEYLSGQV